MGVLKGELFLVVAHQRSAFFTGQTLFLTHVCFLLSSGMT